MMNEFEKNFAILEQQSNKNKGWDDLRELEKLKDQKARRFARHSLQVFLITLLSLEILFLMYIIISEAINTLLFTHVHFSLTEWEFVPFVNVAIFQTFWLIKPIAKNLFPSEYG